jgi:Flp pilus assembly protein TadG
MRLRGGQRGQALLLVTLSLFAMCGLLGLAIDLGWSYFIQKSAQNAADSAALSAAHQALCGPGSSSSCGSPSAPGETVPITCGNVNCQPATACAPGNSNNLSSGCFFAQQNGFTPGGNGGRQNVTIAADLGPVTRYQDGTSVPPVPSCAPGSGVLVGCVEYRVTVRAVEAIPQLFSAVLGNTTAVPSARATAAVIQTLVNGSLITLGRADNLGPSGTPSPITAPNGMVISGPLPSPVPVVTGPIFVPSFVSKASMGTTNTFSILPDGPQFLDPLRGYGQPPLPTSALPTYAVIGSDLSSSPIYQVGTDKVADQSKNYGGGGSPTLPSGNYFPAVWANGCPTSCSSVSFNPGSSNQLTMSNSVTFNDPAVLPSATIFSTVRLECRRGRRRSWDRVNMCSSGLDLRWEPATALSTSEHSGNRRCRSDHRHLHGRERSRSRSM